MTEVAGVQPGSAPLWDSAPRAKAGSASAEISASRAQAGSAPASREEAARIIAENDGAAFPRLRGVPGYQLEPVPWAKAVVLAKEGTEAALGQLGRSPAALVVYHRFKMEVGCGRAGLGLVGLLWLCLPALLLDNRPAALLVGPRSHLGSQGICAKRPLGCAPVLRLTFTPSPAACCAGAEGVRGHCGLRAGQGVLALRLHSPAVRLLAKLMPASCLICIAQWRPCMSESAATEGLLPCQLRLRTVGCYGGRRAEASGGARRPGLAGAHRCVAPQRAHTALRRVMRVPEPIRALTGRTQATLLHAEHPTGWRYSHSMTSLM